MYIMTFLQDNPVAYTGPKNGSRLFPFNKASYANKERNG